MDENRKKALEEAALSFAIGEYTSEIEEELTDEQVMQLLETSDPNGSPFNLGIIPWEPFEDYTNSQLKELIENLAYSYERSVRNLIV